jgi:hypothetical protein
MIAPQDRYPKLLLQIVSRSRRSLSQQAFALTAEPRGINATLVAPTTHSSPRGQTHFECFGYRGIWVFPLPSNLFYKRLTGCAHISSLVTCFLLLQTTDLWNNDIETSNFMVFRQVCWYPACTNCAISVYLRYSTVHVGPKDKFNASVKSRIVIGRFSSIGFFTRATFTSVPDILGVTVRSSSWMCVALFSKFLCHFVRFCTLICHYHTVLSIAVGGVIFFAHTIRIPKRISSKDRDTSIFVTAHNLFHE